MCFLKSVDEKIANLGFIKTREDSYGVSYARYMDGFCQIVDLLHKASGRHLLQSYDMDLMDENTIGNTCVGLTYKEAKLFIRKMKQKGLDKPY